MFLSDAMIKRVNEIIATNPKVKNYSHWCLSAGIGPNVLYAFLKKKVNYITFPSLKRLCDAIDMTLPEFFNVDYILSAECEKDFKNRGSK